MVSGHKFPHSTCLLLLLTALASCGDYGGGSGNSQEEEVQDQDGTFVTDLNPINSSVTGSASFTITQEHLFASVQLQGLGAEARIKQYIMTGDTCPDPGSVLIPLDNDLSGQIVGGIYPQADIQGNVDYVHEANLEDLINDLRDPDPDYGDNLVKLNPDQLLSMEIRSVLVIEIQGTQEVPVACGALARGF